MKRELVKFTNDGYRRCQEVSPFGTQCKERKRHNKDEKPTHTDGLIMWGPLVARALSFASGNVSTFELKDERDVTEFPPAKMEVNFGNAEDDRRAWCLSCGEPRDWDRIETTSGAEFVAGRRSYIDGRWTQCGNCGSIGAPTRTRPFKEPPPAESTATPDPEQGLIDWWMGQAASEAERTIPKAVEYGSTDLIDIGIMLGRTMRRDVDQEEAAELGVFFYLIGKIARWQSAIERGERPSDDTLFDIGVYVRMAQRIRHAGSWPGTEEK